MNNTRSAIIFLYLLLIPTLTFAKKATLSPATQRLRQGILNSDASLVAESILQGAHFTSITFDATQDTALMKATRIFCEQLKKKFEREDPQRAAVGTATKIGAFSISTAVSLGCFYYLEKLEWDIFSRFMWSTVAASTLFGIIITQALRVSHPERVVELLIKIYDRVDERNLEGLTAREILLAYAHYAQELNDNTWRRLFDLLTAKESATSSTIAT